MSTSTTEFAPRPERPMTLLLWLQLLAFAVGAVAHYGLLFPGLGHRRAAIAETVIGGVLLAGICAFRLSRRRVAALVSQSVALLGTLLGAVLIWVGVGPRSPFDFALHGVMLALLLGGIVATLRRSEPRR